MRRTVYQKKKKRLQWLRRMSYAVVVMFFAALTVYGGLLVYAQMTGAPSLTVSKTSVFLNQDEEVIGDIVGSERRYWVELDDISPFLVDAVISTEDQQFYEHHGFNYKRIAGAVLKDIKNRSKVEGASTITQQYARNLHLSHAKTWRRKFEEALIAFRLERFYDKDTILEGYLNTIYFGHGMYGVEAASHFYFGHSATDLTLEESAVIAAIAKGPSVYSPLNHYDNATERKAVVLSLMEQQQVITQTQAERAKSIPITVQEDALVKNEKKAPYFLDAAWKEAEQILQSKGRIAAEGGWTIHTTFDDRHQQIAEEAIQKWMPQSNLEIGFVSIDPDSGAVTSLVGGKDYSASPFNRVTQAQRQPGSAMKPLLYAAALENGFNPLTFLLPDETVFTYDKGRQTYEPKNINGKFADHPISLAQAIAISDNIYAVKTLEEIGYEPFQQMLHRLGLNLTIPSTPSVALGTSEVTLFDMTGAYHRIAASGIDREPYFITSILDSRGRVVYERTVEEDTQAIAEEDAFLLTHLMTGMFDPVFNDYLSVTGQSMRQKQTRPYAAKSGTTISDQYLIGFSPTLTAGVWTGYDDGSKLEAAEDQAVTKKVWMEFMETVHSGKTPEAFEPPAGVESAIVDVETGGLAVQECKRQRLVYVKSKDMPTKLCTDPSLQKMKQQDDEPKKFNLFPFSFFD